MARTLSLNKKIGTMVRQEVISFLREVLSDPDLGLSLRPQVTRRLKKSVRSKKAGEYKSLGTIRASGEEANIKKASLVRG